MPAQLNHTIVHAREKQRSPQFLAGLLGLAQPTEYGPFLVVRVANDVSLDFVDESGTIQPQHYAFLVSEEEFDQIFERIKARDLTYWADPSHRQPGRINTNDGGPGFDSCRPDRPHPATLTQPYR